MRHPSTFEIVQIPSHLKPKRQSLDCQIRAVNLISRFFFPHLNYLCWLMFTVLFA